MTYTELKNEVAILTGNPDVSTSIILGYANRALRDIFFDINVEGKIRVATHGSKPSTYIKEIHCPTGKEVVLPLNGRAFSMRFYGVGQYMLDVNGKQTTTRVISPYQATTVKHFVGPNTTLTVWGGISFSIFDYAVYNTIYSTNAEDIPEYGDMVSFDLRHICRDFLSFLYPATDSSGNEIPNCHLSDGKILIDPEYSGEILLTYRRLPRVIEGIESEYEDENEVIDIPEEYSSLLPLLVAYYLTPIEEEAQKNCFKTLYDDGIKSIADIGYRKLDLRYTDTNGWA